MAALTEKAHDWRSDARIQMHGIDEVCISESAGKFRDRAADILETSAEILSSVTGNKDHALGTVSTAGKRLKDIWQCRNHWWIDPNFLQREIECVDHRVASYDNGVIGHTLAEEILSGGFSRCEVERR